MAEVTGPLIVVALRWVDLHPTIDPVTAAVRTDPLASGLSKSDEAALEHALRLAEAAGGECLAVTAGPHGADAILTQALSVGASAALRVQMSADEAESSRVAAAVATTLTRRDRPPEVVLCGDYSADRGTGAVPAYLAATLGYRQALGTLSLEWTANARLRAERRLDGGRREWLSVPTPAVCSVEPAGLRLRRGSLPDLLAAREHRIELAQPEVADDTRVRVVSTRAFRPRTRRVNPPTDADPRARVLALTGSLEEHEPPRLAYPADARDAADELLGYLRQHGYLEP